MESSRKRTLRHIVFTGLMAVVLASSMTLPAFAATGVEYWADEDSAGIYKTEAFSDESVGLSWDGADAITLANAALYAIDIEGDATIQLEGESSISYIDCDGSLTISGDTEAATEDKPVLNMVGDQEYESAEIYVYNDATISGVTMNFDAKFGEIYASTGDLTIDQSKISNKSGDVWIGADEASVTITESDIDLGTDYDGGICADTTLTVDNSNISISFVNLDDSWESAIHSHNGTIVLKNMANGEVVMDGDDYAYVTSGDEGGVYLKAASTPGYYKDATPASEGGESPAPAGSIPQTGDETGVAAAGLAVLVVCACAALAVARRRTQE